MLVGPGPGPGRTTAASYDPCSFSLGGLVGPHLLRPQFVQAGRRRPVGPTDDLGSCSAPTPGNWPLTARRPRARFVNGGSRVVSPASRAGSIARPTSGCGGRGIARRTFVPGLATDQVASGRGGRRIPRRCVVSGAGSRGPVTRRLTEDRPPNADRRRARRPPTADRRARRPPGTPTADRRARRPPTAGHADRRRARRPPNPAPSAVLHVLP